jgi:hypothetical protein
MMISHDGKLYLFGCHCLWAVLQMYYDMRYPHRQGASWTHEGEVLAQWLSDQLVFPGQHENINTVDDIRLQTRGELIGDRLLSELSDRLEIIVSTENRKDLEEPLSYYLYSMIAFNVIQQFKQVMQDFLTEADYVAQYRSGIELLDGLSDRIRIILDEIRDISERFKEISKDSASQFGQLWRNKVITEAKL